MLMGPISKVSPIKIIFIGHVVIKPKLMPKTKNKQQNAAATCQLPNIKMNSSNMVISKDFMKEGDDRHCIKEVQYKEMHFKATSLENCREISLLYFTKHLKGLALKETVLLGSET